MAIPIAYNIRNLGARRLTTALTAAGMALVVFVFAAILMMAEGLEQTLVQTGSADNVVVIRKGSASEVQSGVERDQAAILETLPQVAARPDGGPLAAREIVILVTMPRKDTGNPANVQIRGTAATSLQLRPQVRVVRGRAPRPGSSEIMAGTSIARRFQGAGLGESLRFGMRSWQVVGIFDAGNTGFSSEIWADVDQLMQAFRRPVYSSVIFKLADPGRFPDVKSAIENNPRLRLEAKRETRYYEEQSEVMAKFLRILGLSLTIIFSLGATIGAMITMYAAVANRTAEIGTMRALGFRRRSILAVFLVESLGLGMIGGFAGVFFASFLQLMTVSTLNFQTFSELAFSFRLTPAIFLEAMAFAIVMGLAGGILPALRASRMNIVEAVRAT